MRESGHIEVVGRLKDMINRGGQKVFPAEVEAVLVTHPSVAEAYVVGVPDERLGEEVRLTKYSSFDIRHQSNVTWNNSIFSLVFIGFKVCYKNIPAPFETSFKTEL